VLLRIASPAAALCFLSNLWPSHPVLSSGSAGFSWLVVPCALVILAGGWQWCTSSSPYLRRDMFFLVLPGFALLTALVLPVQSGIFSAAGAMLILGGGVLLVYIGYLSHRRWMAGFLIFLALMSAGIPFSPMTVWTESVYPSLLTSAGLPALLALMLSHVFFVGAIFRTAFETVDEFPSNEPLFLVTFSLGMMVALSMLLYPGWAGVTSLSSLAAPVLLLLGGIFLVFLLGRMQHAGSSFFPYAEKLFRPEGLQKGAGVAFQTIAGLVSGIESFLSGEGAMLWSLGIALLLYLVFRGG
jgi:hypothetical protein